MYLIGLCGRSGSGKSTVCRFLSEKGVYCIDADKVCHSVYDGDSRCVDELCARFGREILSFGKVNRALLGKAAYSTKNGIKDLNAIAHKYIIAAILEEANGAFKDGYKFVVVDAPTLFESGLHLHCNGIVAVVANDGMLLNRLKTRDGLEEAMLKKRLAAQKTNSFLVKNCTSVIKNNGSAKDLRKNTYRAMLVLQLKLGLIKPSGEGKRYALKAF